MATKFFCSYCGAWLCDLSHFQSAVLGIGCGRGGVLKHIVWNDDILSISEKNNITVVVCPECESENCIKVCDD